MTFQVKGENRLRLRSLFLAAMGLLLCACRPLNTEEPFILASDAAFPLTEGVYRVCGNNNEQPCRYESLRRIGGGYKVYSWKAEYGVFVEAFNIRLSAIDGLNTVYLLQAEEISKDSAKYFYVGAVSVLNQDFNAFLPLCPQGKDRILSSLNVSPGCRLSSSRRPLEVLGKWENVVGTPLGTISYQRMRARA